MRKIIWSCVICSLFTLVGCATNVARLPKLDANPQSTDAILIVRVDNFDYLDLTKVEPNLGDDPPQQYRILKPSLMFIDSYARAVYKIEAGTYYIFIYSHRFRKGDLLLSSTRLRCARHNRLWCI